MKIGIDIDGVLANFNAAFIALAEATYPDVKFPALGPTYPDKWNFSDGILSPDQLSEVWRLIEVGGFWWTLRPLPGTSHFLQQLKSKYDLDAYFITSRPGFGAKRETEWWLRKWGSYNPTVLVVEHTDDKIPILRALRIQAYVDDNWETVRDAAEVAENVYLFDAPYNQQSEPRGVLRISSLATFWSEVTTHAETY